MTGVDAFIRALSRQRLPLVFNPYAERCPVHDRADAPARRRANLRAYLHALQRQPVAAVWVGRDLGYRGGRRTGLALTDEAHLAACGERHGITLRRATVGAPVAERTAAAVWRALETQPQPVACWNVFPFHPFVAGRPFSNRAYTAVERDLGGQFLDMFVDLTRPARLIAVGGDARRALLRFGYTDVIAVRHPSYGGQQAFFNGVVNPSALGIAFSCEQRRRSERGDPVAARVAAVGPAGKKVRPAPGR